MVTPDDIAVELGRAAPDPGTATYQQWSQWISDALLLIKNRLGDPALLDQETLDYVVRQAVKAQVQRPDDATQVSISVDDGNVARTYSSGSGGVFIKDQWWALLDPDLNDSAVGSTRLYGEPDTLEPDVWTTTTSLL